MTALLAAILGYLLGSIPFGLLLTRLAGYGDIRRVGSGNIGATNVLRTGSKSLAALTVLLDLGKGAAAVIIAHGWGPQAALVAAGCVIIGHMFPVWLGFRGGKGVATALGVLIALAWVAALLRALVWLPPPPPFRPVNHPAASCQYSAPDYRQREPDIAHRRLRQALAARELDPQERLDWLRLCRTDTIGPISFYAMLRRFGSARAALGIVPPLARRGERTKTVTPVTRGEAEAELIALQRLGPRLVCWGEPTYPSG